MNRTPAPPTLLLRELPRRGERLPVALLDLRGRCIRRFRSVAAALRFVRRRRQTIADPGQET